MYNTMKSVIKAGGFDLETVLDRIRYYHAAGKLTNEEMEELFSEARGKAVETIGIDAKAEILALWDAVHELQRQIAVSNTEEPSEPVEEEVPEYVQPTGAHDAYNEGDMVRFNGKVWRCIMNNCVWNPEAYPAGWEEVE